ncbi:MAG: efflux RND transporter periplasmic adaptor subunit [Pseudomonadota bacterium]
MNARLSLALATPTLLALPLLATLAGPAVAAETAAPQTLTVRRSESGGHYVADGLVEAVRQSVLSAQTAGRIVERPVEAGASVKRGSLLVRIDDREAAQAESARRAELAAAEAQLANAQAELERTRQLFQKSLVGQAALDRAETAQRAALAQVRALSASSDVSTTQRSFTRVLAPYDGLVSAVQVQVGDMAVPGKPLLTVYDPSAMRIIASLPVALLSQWQREQTVTVALAQQTLTLTTAAITVLPVTDPNAQQVQVRLDLPQTPAGLLPGMFAKVLFPVGSRPQLQVPTSAVIQRGELSAVYVLNMQNQYSLRQVRLGARSGDFVEVAAGLSDGEQIALDPVAASQRRSKP